MVKRTVLHVGTHKTGTTSLQGVLEANAAFLEAKGFVYPLANAKWENAACNRNAYWLDMAAVERITGSPLPESAKIEAWRRAIAECAATTDATMVLSDERLWYNGTRPGFWEAVRNILAAEGLEDVQVIVYLRRQDLFIESLWAQFLKTGEKTASLETYAFKKKSLAICDYAAGIKRLQQVFGAENITVRVYDRSLMVGGDTVADFLSLLGITDIEGIVRPPQNSNYSLTPTSTVLKLAANRSPLFEEVGKKRLAKAVRAVSREDEEKKGSFFTPEQRRSLLARYEEGNAWIARELLGREDGVLFPLAEGELDAPAFQADPEKLADQACELAVALLREQREKSDAKIAKLEAQVKALENTPARRISRKLRRIIGSS